MTARFLSERWVREAHACIGSIDMGANGRHVIEYQHHDDDLGVLRHSQIWIDGTLSSWTAVPLQPPTIVVTFEVWAAYMWLSGKPAQDAEMGVFDPSGTGWSLPPTPEQLARTCGTQITGASLDLDLVVTDHPLGPVQRTLHFRDGRPVDLMKANVDAVGRIGLALPFLESAGFLLGGVAFPELADRTRLDGDVLALGCLAGIIAPPGVGRRWREAHAAVRHASGALAAMTQAVPRLTALMNATPPP